MGCGTSVPSHQYNSHDLIYRNNPEDSGRCDNNLSYNEENYSRNKQESREKYNNITSWDNERSTYERHYNRIRETEEQTLDEDPFNNGRQYMNEYYDDQQNQWKNNKVNEYNNHRNNEIEGYVADKLEHTVKHPTPPSNENEDDDTPFDDDGIRDTICYNKNNMGLMVKSLDFRTRFLDPEPDERPNASPENLYTDSEFPLETAIIQDNIKIEWKRPKEFVENPKLFANGSTRFDIGQGTAGTCWFLSMLASIADNDKMLKQVIPAKSYAIEDQDRYDGIFHARFFHFGKWEDVYIDDYLPVIFGQGLWGAKSSTDGNEMWVALLEKAFARLHGSYDSIYGGQPGDAYLQLTGGIGERIDLEEHTEKVTTLYFRIKNALNSGSQVCCIVPDEHDKHQGLVGGHAYSLVGVAEVGEIKLIRIRNPWGHGEWRGAWSDGSKEWEIIPQNSVMAAKKDDGEFYVSLEDFMAYFSQTTICSLTPDFDCDGCSDSLNHVLSIYGEWEGKTAAGFRKLLRNPRFCFTVTNLGIQSLWSDVGNTHYHYTGAIDGGYIPIVVQIIQHSEKRKTDIASIRCDIFKVLGDKIHSKGRCTALEILGKKNNVYSTELQSSFRHRLKPGRYVAIPSASDEGLEKAFLLRIFSPAPLENVKELQGHVKIVSVENEEGVISNGKAYQLTFEKTLFGEFISYKNAGGQVCNTESYHRNPQYLITIPNSAVKEVLLDIHILQSLEKPQYPVGFRIFQLKDGTRPPLDTNYLYENYDNSPADLEGTQSKFMVSWDVNVRYILPPGRYVGLVHLDQLNTEKSFSVVFKSTTQLYIKGYQTGN